MLQVVQKREHGPAAALSDTKFLRHLWYSPNRSRQQASVETRDHPRSILTRGREAPETGRPRGGNTNIHFVGIIKVPDMVDPSEAVESKQLVEGDGKLDKDQVEKQLPTKLVLHHHENVPKNLRCQNPEIRPLLGGDNDVKPSVRWHRVKRSISSGSIFLHNSNAQMRWSNLSNYLTGDEISLLQCLHIYVVLNVTGKSSRGKGIALFSTSFAISSDFEHTQQNHHRGGGVFIRL